MEDNSPCSNDSGSSKQELKDSAIQVLEGFKVKVSNFSQPNLAKTLALPAELTAQQEKLLETLSEFAKTPYSNDSQFISVVKEISDKRSFRVLYGQSTGCLYDYALMCLDIYFHTFENPTIVMRTGLGEANLSGYFLENGLMAKRIELADCNSDSFFEDFFAKLHALLFLDVTQIVFESEVRDLQEAELAAQASFIKYARVKFGILEHLSSPMTELADAISTYFVIFKQELKMSLEINPESEGGTLAEGLSVETLQHSEIFKRNPKIAQIFLEKPYFEVLALLHEEVRQLLDKLPSPKEKFGINHRSTCPVVLTEATEKDPQPPESSTFYFQTLKDFRFSNADFWSKRKHVLLENIKDQGNVNTSRLGKEVKVLSQHLPCETHGAIFVVMDGERMDLLKALISGTEDTPYAHGLYEFHIACPDEYPKKPPLVSIVTTGNGKVRFNPNLYDDGYVCLSVINTWDGDPSERWNPAHSNILQVLLSIQVLVMDNMIIQKEPEFEHLASDSWENKLYSNIVRYNNVKYAMLAMLENPPEEFKEVIWRHFALKRNAIMATVDKWLEEGKDFVIPNEGDIDYLVMDHNPHTCTLFKSYSFYSMLLEARNELLKKLDALPSLGLPKDEFRVIEITEDLIKLGGYYKRMNGYMLVEKELSEAGGYRHSLGRCLSPLSKFNKNSTRFAKETEALGTLKCMPNSSIFIVRDTERWDLIKVLISGPLGTDYANGLFLFDVACDEDFPNSAPKVSLITTGRFTVCFHPRLLPTGEITELSWNSEMTLAEFFTQIQEIFKAPHWQAHAALHSCIVRYNNLRYAVLDMIDHPPADFKGVVAAHFEMKKRDIIILAESWIDEATAIEEFANKIEDNTATLEVFEQFGVSGAIESIYSEVVELIGRAVGEDWSQCSDEEVAKEKKQKPAKGMKGSSSELCSESESLNSENERKLFKKKPLEKLDKSDESEDLKEGKACELNCDA